MDYNDTPTLKHILSHRVLWDNVVHDMHALKHIEKPFIDNMEIHLFLIYRREIAVDPRGNNITSAHFDTLCVIMPLEVTFVHFDI